MSLLFGSERSAVTSASCPMSSRGAVLPSACPSPNTCGCSTGGVQAGYLRQRCSSCALLQCRCSYVSARGTGSSFTPLRCARWHLCAFQRPGSAGGAAQGRFSAGGVFPRRLAAPRAGLPPPPARRGWGSLCGPKRQSAGALL